MKTIKCFYMSDALKQISLGGEIKSHFGSYDENNMSLVCHYIVIEPQPPELKEMSFKDTQTAKEILYKYGNSISKKENKYTDSVEFILDKYLEEY